MIAFDSSSFEPFVQLSLPGTEQRIDSSWRWRERNVYSMKAFYVGEKVFFQLIHCRASCDCRVSLKAFDLFSSAPKLDLNEWSLTSFFLLSLINFHDNDGKLFLFIHQSLFVSCEKFSFTAGWKFVVAATHDEDGREQNAWGQNESSNVNAVLLIWAFPSTCHVLWALFSLSKLSKPVCTMLPSES